MLAFWEANCGGGSFQGIVVTFYMMSKKAKDDVYIHKRIHTEGEFQVLWLRLVAEFHAFSLFYRSDFTTAAQ